MMTLTDTPPRFITFEGTEGVGKTTAVDGFCERLTAHGIDFVRTREPGGSELGENLRKILLDKNTHLHDDTELLLIFCARNDHLHRLILPALAKGKWVICDRFIDSTMAYQGFGRAKGDVSALQKIQSLIDAYVPLLPHLTFWLDLDIDVGMTRAKNRSPSDRFESNDRAFFERVHQGFLHQYRQQYWHKYDDTPTRIWRIDASQSQDKVLDDIWQITLNRTAQ